MSTTAKECAGHEEDLVHTRVTVSGEAEDEGPAEAQTSHGASSAHASAQARARSRASLSLGARRGREKPQLSCKSCRQRKAKCDRKQPCSACAQRGQLCTYALQAENRPAVALLRPKSTTDGILAMHDRLVELERLVTLMSRNRSKESCSPSQSQSQPQLVPSQVQGQLEAGTPATEASEYGSMRLSGSDATYVNDEHWATIMDNIAVLKEYLDREEQLKLINSPNVDHQDPTDPLYSSNQRQGASLLYGCRRFASREQIIASLPPKDALDRYVSQYFNYVDLVASSVHGPSFLRQYEAFWLDPTHTSIIWVGLLFGILCLAVMASPGSEMEQQRMQIDMYRERAVQCLIIGEYSKGGPNVLEAVIHYLYVEMLSRRDAFKDLWYLLALEVNLAKRMGYHRDPSHFTGITPLEAEMRRRLWVVVLLSDLLISSQMGMPRMVVDWQCDTSEPRNLYDTDLDPESSAHTELPMARPETEHTTALGIIARRRMLAALGAISDLTSATKSCSYTEVMRVDAVLHECHERIPPLMRMRSMASSITDSPQLIMSRLFLAHMFYKGQLMLHRRFLRIQHQDQDVSSIEYSRKACLDASLGTLQIQHILDEETCAGGQLHMMRWRMTSMMNHQFLTATMILCVLLQRGQTSKRDEEIRTALRKTRSIWLRGSTSSREARKGADAVSLVLARFGGDPPNQDGEPSRRYGEPLLPALDDDLSTPVSGQRSEMLNSYGQSSGLFDATASSSDLGRFTGLNSLGSPFPGQDAGTLANPFDNDGILENWIMMNDIGMTW